MLVSRWWSQELLGLGFEQCRFRGERYIAEVNDLHTMTKTQSPKVMAIFFHAQKSISFLNKTFVQQEKIKMEFLAI